MNADRDFTGSRFSALGVMSSPAVSPRSAPRAADQSGTLPSTLADNGGGDVAGDLTTTSTITVGATITGDIANSGDQDWYAINLTMGQSYYFSLTATGGTPLGDPGLKIFASSASGYGVAPLFADNDGGAGNNAAGFFRAGYTGTYYVAAQGFGGAGGGYSLSVANGPVDDIGDGNGLPLGAITTGQTVSSTLSSGGDQDVFSVTLEAEHTYLVTLNGVSAGGFQALSGAQFGVFDTSGSWSAQLGIDTQAGEGDPARVVVTPTATGIHYIKVNPYPTASVALGGSYTLSIADMPADIAAATTTTASLAVGSSMTSYIDSGSDADWVAVTLTAGKTYSFQMNNTGGNYFDPNLTLVSGAGTSLLSDDDGGYENGALIRYTATVSGTYYLKAYGAGQKGEYTLAAAEIPSDVAGDATTTASLAIGQQVTDYLSGTADRDWYSVSLTAGQTYIFSLHEPYNNGLTVSPFFELRSSAGSVLASDQASGYYYDDQIVYTATASGTYFLSFGFTGSTDRKADYVLGARAINDIGATNGTSQALSVGQSWSSLIDYNDDHDRYAITLQEGYTYDLTLDSSLSPEARGLLEVYSSAGAQVAEATSSYGDARITTMRFTATATGTFYLDAGTSNELIQSTGYTITAKLSDSIPASRATTATLAVGATITGTVDYSDGSSRDADWYAITLTGGQSYIFATASGATGGINSPEVSVYSSAGALLDTQASYTSAPANLQFYAATSGTYYVSAGSSAYGSTGAYSLSASTTSDVFDDTSTHNSLAIGSTFQSTIDTSGDQDWFKVDLVAGQSYVFTVDQFGATPLADCYVTLYDGNGTKLGYDDDGGIWPNSVLRYTPLTSGSYYVAASGFETAIGGYTVGAKAVAPQDPLDTIDWGTQITDTSVKVYFALSGETFSTNTATRAWTAAEKSAFMAACQTWAAVTNVTFTQVSSSAAATMIVLIKPLTGDTAAFMQTPPGTPQVGVFDPYWGATTPAPGSVWFSTFIHEVGHFLGLAHPHDSGGGSEVMEGVYADDMGGTAGLNHGVYTIMSYNEALNGISSSTYGDVATPMALDVAVVQQKYGATVRNAGNDTYTLATFQNANYSLIWDTGGTDTIVAGIADLSVTIDLRPATLLNAPGGGGYVSSALGVSAGFTIAYGVVIENATGNSGNDALWGNAAANSLQGMGGDDVLTGGAGADVLDGGSGSDTISYSTAAGGVTVFLGGTQFNTGDAQGDSYISVENVTGSAFADILGGDNAANVINGADGNDWLSGSGGNDTLQGGNGNDVLEGGAGADSLDGGTGYNVASYRNSTTGIVLDMGNTANSTGDATGDSLTNIQNLWGTVYNDTIRSGIWGGGQVYGFEGNDVLAGFYGNDVFYGGTGADTITTGDGADDLFFLSWNDHYNQYGTLEAFEGGDTVTDFQHGTDHLIVSRYWFGFGNIGGPAAALTSTYADFKTSGGATSTRPTFFWNQATGVLMFDPDGTGAGAAVNLATLTGATLTLSDIWTA